jgi:hypothetical protein
MRCSNSTNKADTVQVKLLYVVFVQVLLLKILFTLLCTSSLVIVQSIQKVQVQNTFDTVNMRTVGCFFFSVERTMDFILAFRIIQIRFISEISVCLST